MTTIEIFALIAAIAVLIKLLVILTKPKAWMNLVEKIYNVPSLTMIVSLVLSAVVLYYLLQEITIIQIFAAMLFIALLAAATMSTYFNEVKTLAGKLLKQGAIRKAWLSIVIWLALSIWVLYVLFA